MRGQDPDSDSPSNQTLTEEVGNDSDSLLAMLGHFYRGEVERTVSWRTRLDQTTNWSVVLMAAILTFVFSSENNPHYVLLIGALAVAAFLIIESQRYQEYDAWRYRVRLIQRHYIANITDRDQSPEPEWRDKLARDLREPTFEISRLRAITHRLKRVYLLLLTVLLAAWVLRITVFDDSTWSEAASIANIPGVVIVAVVGLLYLALCGLALWSFYGSRAREFQEETASDDA